MRFRSSHLDRLFAVCIVYGLRLLFRTLRIRYRQADPTTNPYTGTGPAVIYSVWHDVMVYPIFGGRHQRTVALVSKHGDGSLLASCLSRLGVGLVRGSSSRSAVDALRALIRLPADRHIVLTPDGPRGPEHQMKSGMTLLAARTGRAVVPTGFAAVRCWKISGGWTHFQIPRPFTTVYFVTGSPMHVSSSATRERLGEMEQDIQSEMDRLTKLAEGFAGVASAVLAPVAFSNVEPALGPETYGYRTSGLSPIASVGASFEQERTTVSAE